MMEKCNRSISELKYPFIIYLNSIDYHKTPNISPPSSRIYAPQYITLLFECFSVLMKLIVQNCTRNHVFCLLSSSNMAFCCKSIVFCLIPFFFLEIQIRGMKNSRRKNASVYQPRRIYAPLCISPPKNACGSV